MYELNTWDIALRLGLAMLAGATVGFERERRGRVAGMRTTALTCTAAAIAMILSEYLYVQGVLPGGNWRADPGRIAAGILTGMGFLGGGTIMKHGNVVRGVTTAAGLWFITVVGLALGSGMYWLGLAGWVIAMTMLYGLARLESHIGALRYGQVTVICSTQGACEDDIRRQVEELGVRAHNVAIDLDVANQLRTVQFETRYHRTDKSSDLPKTIVAALAGLNGVRNVQWK